MQNNVVTREGTGIFGLTSSYSIPYARPTKWAKTPILCQQVSFLRKTPSDWEDGDETGFTTVYTSSAVPSFRADGCYLYLNDIIAFPPARVLPNSAN